ncbi:MAG TPA: glycosyltransferase, partial [Polyangiaceae bacterium]|nr:glycosyltransferase [Polyangiaceae bacterium]
VSTPRAPARFPGVSVLKPLCGTDAELESNLRSFFEQDYPHLQLVFGVESASDPAIATVERLRRRFPSVVCTLVVHGGGRGKNPKVSNLLGMSPAAHHELLLVSDSNVRAPAHYVRELVSVLESEPNVGLVTNLFAGAGENTLGAALENVQLNGFCASGTTLPTLLGDSAVVGKSLLFRRGEFVALGGFEAVSNVLAEDFMIGKMFEHAGRSVRIAPSVLLHTTSGMSVGSYLGRHLRWCMLRVRLRPLAYALEPLTSPLFLLPAALFAFGYSGLLWTAGMLIVRDVGGWLVLRGPERAWLPLVLCVARELTILGVWACAPLKRHVTWRGHKVRLGAGTLLFAAKANS